MAIPIFVYCFMTKQVIQFILLISNSVWWLNAYTTSVNNNNYSEHPHLSSILYNCPQPEFKEQYYGPSKKQVLFLRKKSTLLTKTNE